jgi:Phage derived protein Gp49-like (DUF891)
LDGLNYWNERIRARPPKCQSPCPKHVGKLNTRVLWFLMKGRRIVLLHGIRNKGQAIPARDLITARERDA